MRELLSAQSSVSTDINVNSETTLTTVVLRIILEPNMAFVSNQAVRGIVLAPRIPSASR